MNIPVFEPEIGEEEIAAVVAALKRGEISGTFGESIPTFEQEFADFCGATYGIAVNSGSSALLIAIAAAGIGPGDEVIVSASTNIASALAIVHNGALPVPVDSEPDTWNIDLDQIDAHISPRTKAIMPVHLYGHPVDMDRVGEIAAKHHLLVVDDAAEAHGAEVRERKIGSFGDMTCFSFYANKIITTGEGGMIVTNDAALAEKLRLLRDLGFIEPRFRHEIAGYNFRMPGFVAAFGVAQVRKITRIIDAKRQMAHRYTQRLKDIPGLGLPVERDWAKNVYWMYGITINEAEFGKTRDQLAACLRAEGIGTRTFFCPMNQQPVLAALPGFSTEACPVADRLWETGLYVPSSHTLSQEQINSICDAITKASNQ